MLRALLGLVSFCALSACDRAPTKAQPEPSAQPHAVATPQVASEALEHDEAGHERKAVPVASATSLSADVRARLTTLRVSAHVGSVIVRKSDAGWTIGGSNGCVVDPARIEQVLDNLSQLSAEPTQERPQDFELQISALMNEERALHFDVAGRRDGRDLIQLNDHSAFQISGLDRELWSPDPRVWCGH